MSAPTVSIEPIARDQIGRLAHLTLPPEQIVFSGLPADVMNSPAARDGHMILADGRPVGFFAIDRDYDQTYDFAPAGVIGLRMFSVDHAYQGQGIASTACRMLAAYLPAHYPTANAVYLTVNHRNPGAKKAYLNGGFTDTGADYLDGGMGPQYIMRMDLPI